MAGDRDDLVETFRNLSDEYLLERVRSGDLTDPAQEIAERELIARGIAVPPRRPHPADPEPQSAPLEFTTLAQFFIPTDAHILKGRLEAAGIPVLLTDSNLTQTHNLIAIAVGGVRVQVPVSQLPEAMELLAAIRSGAMAVGDDTDPESNDR